MDTTAATDPLAPAPGTTETDVAPRTTVPRWWPRVAALVAVLALVVGAVFGWRWWTHPNVLPTDGGNQGGSAHPAGTAWSFGITYPAPGHGQTITFTEKPVPQIGRANTDATVVVSICHRRLDQSAIGGWIGDLSKFCTRLSPVVAGTQFTYPSRTEYLVMTVTPHHPGSVVVTSVDFPYRTGSSDSFRRGTQRMDLRVSVKTSHRAQ